VRLLGLEGDLCGLRGTIGSRGLYRRDGGGYARLRIYRRGVLGGMIEETEKRKGEGKGLRRRGWEWCVLGSQGDGRQCGRPCGELLCPGSIGLT
jgi:hypothetical protein